MIEYGVLQHGMMLGDTRRLGAYVEALEQVVFPGAVVADIGSGTAIFALVACRAGARRVFAIEPGHIMHTAREIVAANGCGDRIECLAARSTEVSLPERADVVVLDVRGVLPDEQMAIAADARRRLLKPGGTIVPALDTVWAALVTAPEAYEHRVGVWRHDEEGVDLSPVAHAMANGRYKSRFRVEQLVVEPQVVWRCDYGADEIVERRATLGWTVGKTALVHGVAVWFDSVLAPNVEFSNHPGAPELLYGQAFFPWLEPVGLTPGDEVRLGLHARPTGGGYRWDWTTTVQRHASPTAMQFEQTVTIE